MTFSNCRKRKFIPLREVIFCPFPNVNNIIEEWGAPKKGATPCGTWTIDKGTYKSRTAGQFENTGRGFENRIREIGGKKQVQAVGQK